MAASAPVQADAAGVAVESRAPSWKATYSILLACHTGMFVAFQSSLPFITLYVQELGVPDQAGAAAWSGTINGTALAIYAVMNVVWGAISDRWGLKAGLIRSILFATAGFAIAAVAQRPEHVFVARITSSIGGGANAAALSLAGMLVPTTNLGLAMGLMQTGASLGGTLGPALGGFLGDFVGFRASFLVSTVLGLVMAACVALFVREPERPRQRDTGERFFDGLTYLAHTLITRRLILLLLFYQVGYQVVLAFVPLRLQELVEADQVGRWSGAALIADAIGIAIGSAVMGGYSRRVGEARLLVATPFLSAAITLVQIQAGQPEMLVVLRFLLGLCSGGFLSVLRTILGTRADPARRGLAFGVSQGAFSAAISVGSVVGSLAITRGGLTAAFWLSAVVLTGAGGWAVRTATTRDAPALA